MKFEVTIKRTVFGKVFIEAEDEDTAADYGALSDFDDVYWDDFSEEMEVVSVDKPTKDCNNGYR